MHLQAVKPALKLHTPEMTYCIRDSFTLSQPLEYDDGIRNTDLAALIHGHVLSISIGSNFSNLSCWNICRKVYICHIYIVGLLKQFTLLWGVNSAVAEQKVRKLGNFYGADICKFSYLCIRARFLLNASAFVSYPIICQL